MPKTPKRPSKEGRPPTEKDLGRFNYSAEDVKGLVIRPPTPEEEAEMERMEAMARGEIPE